MEDAKKSLKEDLEQFVNQEGLQEEFINEEEDDLKVVIAPITRPTAELETEGGEIVELHFATYEGEHVLEISSENYRLGEGGFHIAIKREYIKEVVDNGWSQGFYPCIVCEKDDCENWKRYCELPSPMHWQDWTNCSQE